MSSRKEEERNEKIIRGLMKLPPNRRCINCNSLGPQFVCTNFWTFVCMTCSGIHREFTHRVKSVSMSKFTSQEVESLQEGGNQRARETFLKDWDPRGQRLPDNSNVDKVREFIKNVYVDKKFFASKTSGKPPLNIRNHEDETRRASSYHSYSQSPPYDYQYEERRYGKQAPSLTKKPGSDRGMLRFMSSTRLSDHVQEDGFANEVPNARVSDFSVSSVAAADPFRSGNQSPQSTSSPPPVQSVVKESTVPIQSNSSEPGKFGGLDLFGPQFAPQSATTSSASSLDLFSVTGQQPLDETTKDKNLDLFGIVGQQPLNETIKDKNFDLFGIVVGQQPLDETKKDKNLDLFGQQPLDETVKDKSLDQKNEGWATFDMPWHSEPKSSSIVVPEASTSDEFIGKFDQNAPEWSFQQDFSALHNPWDGGLHDIVDPINAKTNQSWSSFEETSRSFTQSSEQVSVQDPSVADVYLPWGISENFEMKPFVSTTPHVIGSLDSSVVLPPMDGAQSNGVDTKSRNPFDLDDDVEASDIFLDMSSLQSAIPNHNSISTPWFPESSTIPYNSDSLVYMAGQAPNMQIPNIQGQGPVASIGGNPFG